MAKDSAETTSDPRQDAAIQSATLEAKVLITQRQPGSQYGQGVEEVDCLTQGWAQAGNWLYILSAKPLIEAVFATVG